jgi:hypothetical protein
MNTIQEITERNRRVELDKAWETSWTRRGLIALITYGIATVFMWRIGVVDPQMNALVPTGGYLLSTLSLGYVKNWWLKKYGA